MLSSISSRQHSGRRTQALHPCRASDWPDSCYDSSFHESCWDGSIAPRVFGLSSVVPFQPHVSIRNTLYLACASFDHLISRQTYHTFADSSSPSWMIGYHHISRRNRAPYLLLPCLLPRQFFVVTMWQSWCVPFRWCLRLILSSTSRLRSTKRRFSVPETCMCRRRRRRHFFHQYDITRQGQCR